MEIHFVLRCMMEGESFYLILRFIRLDWTSKQSDDFVLLRPLILFDS